MPNLTMIAARRRARSGNSEGATAVEYGLLVSLISVVLIAGVTLVGKF
jgi:Flp pilus assembly pilin Flp